MPIYEYQCKKCGHQLETLQGINEVPLKKCPNCGKSALTKLISAAGFQLKGTGWYVTDFRNKDKKPTAEESKTDAGSSTVEKTTNKTEK